MKKLKCKRCDYEWIKRIEKSPKQCPRCKNLKWNEEKEYGLDTGNTKKSTSL